MSYLIVHHPKGGHCRCHMRLHEVREDEKSRYLCNFMLSPDHKRYNYDNILFLPSFAILHRCFIPLARTSASPPNGGSMTMAVLLSAS